MPTIVSLLVNLAFCFLFSFVVSDGFDHAFFTRE